MVCSTCTFSNWKRKAAEPTCHDGVTSVQDSVFDILSNTVLLCVEQIMLSQLKTAFARTRSPRVLVRLYHENIIDHYENPRNVGSLDAKKTSVGTGLVGAPACGDVMKVQFEVDDDGTIIDAKFKTFGCGSAIASSSLATEWLKGRKVDDCLSIKVTHLNSYEIS